MTHSPRSRPPIRVAAPAALAAAALAATALACAALVGCSSELWTPTPEPAEPSALEHLAEMH